MPADVSEIRFTSEIKVDYIDHMGNDQRIVEAMLVSTKGLDAREAAQSSVEGRIKFLMCPPHDVAGEVKRGVPHGSPFECGALTVRVHAPICVWREWHRHRAGFSYNEESGRYKDLDPVFYIPPRERLMIRPLGFKSSRPAFDRATDEEYEMVLIHLKLGYQHAYMKYIDLLKLQVDRGLARDVLGVGIYSCCYITCNPRSIMHFLELRTKLPMTALRPSNPLFEIDVPATQLEVIFARLWPITHRIWHQNGRMAP